MTNPRTVSIDVGQRLGKEGQLEVTELLSVDTTSASGKKRVRRCCRVVCHECKKDPELYSDATYVMSIYDAVSGNLPCGCSPIPKKTVQQWRIVAERHCAEKSLKFLSFGEWKGQKTKLKLSCNVCQQSWDSATLGGLVTGRGCPNCAWEARRTKRMLSYDATISKFFSTGSYKEGTVFSKVGDRGRIWQYTCPSCSSDEFVKAGACTGVFVSDRTNFIAGKLSCRCAYNHKWSQAEREYQISQLCKKDGRTYEFKGWKDADGYKDQSSRLNLHCEDHGPWEASVASFIDNENGCPNCSNGGGFDRSKDGCFYVFQAEGRVPFTGYGVSNSADKRLAEHARNLAQRSLKIGATQIFYASGEAIWETERQVKKHFELHSQDISGFKTEATYYEHYQAVCDFVDKWLFENT